jgi:hypothetical protein
MAFAPSQRGELIRERKLKSHNVTIKRVYGTWDPRDLAVLERQPPRVRAQILRMVASDYREVVITTSRLVLYRTARFPRSSK